MGFYFFSEAKIFTQFRRKYYESFISPDSISNQYEFAFR